MSPPGSGLREDVSLCLVLRRFYPIIPVVIRSRKRTVVYALVDSGATTSLFHTSIAEDIEVDLEDAEQA